MDSGGIKDSIPPGVLKTPGGMEIYFLPTGAR
jgi:hypothetical protein